MKTQIHLGFKPDGSKRGSGYSGRAVRVQALSPTQVQAVRDLVGTSTTEETRVMQFEDRLMREGVEQSIVEYTDAVSPKDLPSAKWIKATAEQVHSSFEVLFTAKDVSVLTAWYRREHFVSQNEVEDILGGAIGVVD